MGIPNFAPIFDSIKFAKCGENIMEVKSISKNIQQEVRKWREEN
jgi:hypothetical protein